MMTTFFRRGMVVLAAAACLPACGPSGGDADAGADAEESWPNDVAAEVNEPAPPALPVLTPCPEGWRETPAGDPPGPVRCEPWPEGGPAMLTPCPDGWREVPDTEAGVTVCEPWPPEGPTACGDDEAHFAGEPGCSRIGTACAPDDDWAVDLPAGSTIRYVKAGAPAGGDGSRDAPFATVAEAMAVATAGDIVAVAKGTYDEQVLVGAGVTVWGACVAETTLTNSVPDMSSAVVQAQGRDGTVRNLRVTGERFGVYARSGRSLTVRDVVIDGATSFGLIALVRGRITAENVVVRNTRPDADLDFGWAADAEDGGVIRLARVVFEKNRELGVFASGAGSIVEGADVVIRDTEPSAATDLEGRGITAQDGGRVTLERAVIENNRMLGVAAAGTDAVVDLTDAVVRDTRVSFGDGDLGIGLTALEGGRITARRTLVDRNHTGGVNPRQPGSTIELEDVVVRDTRAAEYGRPLGRGMEVTAGGRLVAVRTVVARNLEVGIVAAGAGTTLELTDVAVRDTRSQPADGLRGDGLVVQDGATAVFARLQLDRNRNLALQVASAGSTLRGTDLVVTDTQPQAADDLFGFGVQASHGAAVELSRVWIERAHGVGLLAGAEDTRLRLTDAVVRNVQELAGVNESGRGIELQGPLHADLERIWLEGNRDVGLFVALPAADVSVTDLTVSDTRSRSSDGTVGIGMTVQDGAVATVLRGRVVRSRMTGISVIGPGARLEAADLAVVDTLLPDCATTTCAGRSGGSGVVVLGGAAFAATRFALRDNALCGLQLALGTDTSTGRPYPAGGVADLHEGDITGNVVGVNVQTPGFDVGRLQDRVRCYGNERNLDLAMLPVPDSTLPPTGF